MLAFCHRSVVDFMQLTTALSTSRARGISLADGGYFRRACLRHSVVGCALAARVALCVCAPRSLGVLLSANCYLRGLMMSDVTEIKEKEPSLMNSGVAVRAQHDDKRGTRGRPAGSRVKSSGSLRRLQVTLTDRGFERLEKMRQMSDALSQADVV